MQASYHRFRPAPVWKSTCGWLIVSPVQGQSRISAGVDTMTERNWEVKRMGYAEKTKKSGEPYGSPQSLIKISLRNPLKLYQL